MERILSQEERIRRAEEIYNRRRYENKYNANQYAYIERRRDSAKPNSVKTKKKIVKKMMLQMLICTIIYFAFYFINNSKLIFSEDVNTKTKELLSYDISLSNIEENQYFKNVKEYFNGLIGRIKNNGEESKNQKTENVTNEENTNSENLENENSENVENSNSENIQTQDANESTEKNQNIESIGGAEEVAVEETKTQEEQDIDYVKQNINIIWPLTGVITSKFGSRTATEIVTANHYGIDIAGNTGTSIVSAIDGTVTQNSSEGDYGKHLRIENGEVMTLYAHCSKLLVNEGDSVKQGQIIAEVGSTGRATGPHLHFEIRRENRFINPESILGSM